MFERVSRSYELMKCSWNVLRQDKELILFPILSGIASLLTVGSFIIPIVLYVLHQRAGEVEVSDQHLAAAWYAYMFVFYVFTFFVQYYFNVAVMHCAAIRMNGGDPTVADGFRGANEHAVAILGWAAVSATVGLVLRTLEQRLGLLGRIVAGLIGCAWTIVTYFAVPVLIFERVGVGTAIKRSAELLKATWGEAMVARAGLSVVSFYFGLLGLLPIGLGAWLAAQGVAPAIFLAAFGVAIVYWLALAIISSALTSIFNVALYRYATTGKAPDGYRQELIVEFFQPRR